jgi:hypothetical protein
VVPALSRGLPEGVTVEALAIEPGSATLHAATDFGVFSVSRVDQDSCVGDCDGDARVTIGELTELVGTSLLEEPLPECGYPDRIHVSDVVAAVRSALGGCNRG